MTTHKELEAEIGAGYLAQILELKGIRAVAEYDAGDLATIREVRGMMRELNSRSVRRALAELEKAEPSAAGDKPGAVKGQIQTAQKQSSSIVRKDELELVKSSAQEKAAGLTVAKNVITAHYLSTGDFSDRPDLDESVAASKTFLENVLTGKKADYSMDSIILAAAEVAMFGSRASEVAPETFTLPVPSGSPPAVPAGNPK